MAKAGIIIIGNEILSGKTQDINTKFLGEELGRLGVDLREVRTIPDEENFIIETVNHMRKKYDFIMTTGGIGPTHDDITTESVSKALGIKYGLNELARQELLKHYGNKVELNKERLKMAYTPEGAELIKNPVSGAPGFKIENIYVFAGIPNVMQAMFKQIEEQIDTGLKIISVSVDVMLPESIIAPHLAKLQEKYPDINMGSYPFNKAGKWGANLVLRGKDQVLLENAKRELEEAMSKL